MRAVMVHEYLCGKYFAFTEQEDQDWGIVAMVLDRLFLWVFGLVALIGSLMILSGSPYIYDEIKPIDVLFSKIAAEEKRNFANKILA